MAWRRKSGIWVIPILKQSKPERQEKISQFNKDIAELIEGYSRFSRSKSDQANFLAGMILAQDKSSSNIDVLYRLSYLYLRIASIIENELRILLQTKIKERLQESTNESDNFHDVLKSIDLKAENLDTISFGDCIHGIIKWNGKYSNNLIISLEFNESLKELQRHNADNIRNMFVHGDFSKKKFAKPEMVEEGLRALLSFIKTNNTLFRENQ
jgi:hypothetical protein